MGEELSIEEKAERYDEVLRIVKDSHTHHYDDREQLRKIESVFYEINEDEDERIRKEIIDYIKDQQSSFISAPDCRDKYEEEENNKYNSWIAWLEKEDKQKPYGQRKECIDCRFNYAGECKGYCTLKRNEQKPSKCSEEDKKYMSAVIKMVEHCSFSSIGGITKAAAIDWLKFTKDHVQLNQGWSEDDEAILNWCISEIERAKYCKSQIKPKLCDDEINRLRSIKDRVQLQNLVVINEELAQAKKDAYNDALDKIEYHSGDLTFDDGWSAAIDYIKKKFLNHQKKQWKPSKKQLVALNDLNIAGYLKNVGQGDILIELYNDLKKLAE